MIAVVMMVSGLRVMWRMDRPVKTVVSPKKCVVIVFPWLWLASLPARCRCCHYRRGR